MHVKKEVGVRLLAVLSAFALLLGMSGGTANAAPSAAGNKTFSGYSHDIKVYLLSSGAPQSGPVVAAGVGCSDRAPLLYQDSAAGVSLGGVNLGAVTTTSRGVKSGTVQETRSTFQATGVNIPLLTASLTADAITINSHTFYDTATGQFTTSSDMTVANLDVKLTPITPPIIHLNGTVDPNEGLVIPGIATLALHSSQEVGSQAFGAVGRATAAIEISLVGSLVKTKVGEAYSSLYGETDQTWMFGAGEGVRVSALDQALTVGPLVTAQLPCNGNGGVTAQVLGTVGVLPGSLGSLGAVTSTATGSRAGLTSDATTTSEVAAVNLLGGVVTADALKSTSHAASTDGAQTVSTAGSGAILTNLTIGGVLINPNTPVNTVITLPAGLGYVVVNGRNTFSSGVEVIPLMVHVNAVNADIVVARSYAVLFGPEMSAAARRQAEKFLDKQMTAKDELAANQRAIKDGSLKKLGLVPKP